MKLRTLTPLGLVLLAGAAAADTAVYDLGANNARETAQAINNALQAQCGKPTGTENVAIISSCRAELLPSGQLLVEAPAASQKQIADLLKLIAARDASPTPRVTLQYWVLYGEPGKPGAPDAVLKPLDPVLQQLQRVNGPIGFAVRDTTTITTQSGTNASAKGDALQINESVRVNGDNVNVAIQLTFAPRPQPPPPTNNAFYTPPAPQSLNVDVTMKRGEFLVLGERTAGGSDTGRLFYVVHWPQGQ
jgi:hypothetical protein